MALPSYSYIFRTLLLSSPVSATLRKLTLCTTLIHTWNSHLIFIFFFCSATPNTCFRKILKQANVRIIIIIQRKMVVAWDKLAQKLNSCIYTWVEDTGPFSDSFSSLWTWSTKWQAWLPRSQLSCPCGAGRQRQLILCMCSGLFAKWMQSWLLLLPRVSWRGLTKIRVNSQCPGVVAIEWLLINSEVDSLRFRQWDLTLITEVRVAYLYMCKRN